jgi:hypothetical protein
MGNLPTGVSVELKAREQLQLLERLEALEEGLEQRKGSAAMGLNRRLESAALRSFYPSADDPLVQAAYTAAALRGLAEAVSVLQQAKK